MFGFGYLALFTEDACLLNLKKRMQWRNSAERGNQTAAFDEEHTVDASEKPSYHQAILGFYLKWPITVPARADTNWKMIHPTCSEIRNE